MSQIAAEQLGIPVDVAAAVTSANVNSQSFTSRGVETSADATRISIAFEEARKTRRPVAVLMADEYHGFNR